MEIRVLGKSPAFADAGGACSGYLVQEGDFTLLLDCGSGVFAKLRSYIDYADVDAVLITHLHADHFLDLIPFSFALKYSTRAPFDKPTLWAPPGAGEFFSRLGEVMAFAEQLSTMFDVREYRPGESEQIGPFTARFQAVPHYIQTHACDLAGASGSRMTFGADSGPSTALQEFARDSDLLMLEATEQSPPPDSAEEPRGHMTAREAGELAAGAHARRVLITHFSDELDAGTVKREAEAGFGRDVEIAHEGSSYAV